VDRIEFAFNIRDDVHDVTVALDGEAVVTFTVPVLATRPDIVASKIEQHQMFRAFFLVGEQFEARRSSSSTRALRQRVPAMGRIVTLSLRGAPESPAGADDLELRENRESTKTAPD